MSTPTRNFTLRLSALDQIRLERLAGRLDVDRTGALRLLLRRAASCWSVSETAAFYPISHARSSSLSLPVRLRLKGGRG